MSAGTSSHGPSGSGFDPGSMHAEFMAFVTDEASAALMRSFAERQGFPASSVQNGGTGLFAEMLEHAAAPKLVFVDIDGESDAGAAVARLKTLCGADSKLIAVGSANDVGLYRRMIQSGMADYLVKPLSAEALTQTYAAVLRGGGGGKGEAREAKTIVVIGSRGGVGATTIAVNVGWLLAHRFKFQCALLDLDLQFGTSALSLDLEPGRGLRDVVASPSRVDSLMVASSMVAASERFSVLGAEESIEEHVAIDGSAITALLKEMRGNFDFILVDLPRHLLGTQKRLLAVAHEIVLVSELSLAGIRDTLRLKNAIAALGGAARVTIVSSRASPNHPGQIDETAFEKGAQVKVDCTIPEDSKAVTLAANSGKALMAVAPDAPATKALSALAAKLGDKPLEPADAKKGLFGWLNSGSPAPSKGKPQKPQPGAQKDKS